jgi:hypothetical protein
VRDEWVVIEPTYRAVELAARLNPVRADQPVYGRFSFATARMLRRTLALELAHCPNGLFAAKLALKGSRQTSAHRLVRTPLPVDSRHAVCRPDGGRSGCRRGR